MKNISVIGLGYVGTTSAVCFSKLGHKVYGVDINENKVAKLRLKQNPLPRVRKLDSFIQRYPFEVCYKNHKEAIINSDISFVAVETPSNKNGSLNLMPLRKACRDIGKVLKNKDKHVVVIRSTIFPGSLDILKKDLEKYSGKKEGDGFYLATNPEFLREIQALNDFFDPSYIVVGAENKSVGQKVMGCYRGIDTKKFIVDNSIAQMIKYVNNSWHGAKVAFTNEIGNLCEKLKIDGDKVMELFCKDKKLNVSTYYHRIGGPFGGHCLPKELSVIQDQSKKLKLKSYLLDAITKSNDEHKKRYKE